MSKAEVTTFHMSPSGKFAWVSNSKRRMPFPVTVIHGRAPLNKSGTKLRVPKGLRGLFVVWLTAKKPVWYSPDPKRHRGKENCGGAGSP